MLRLPKPSTLNLSLSCLRFASSRDPSLPIVSPLLLPASSLIRFFLHQFCFGPYYDILTYSSLVDSGHFLSSVVFLMPSVCKVGVKSSSGFICLSYVLMNNVMKSSSGSLGPSRGSYLTKYLFLFLLRWFLSKSFLIQFLSKNVMSSSLGNLSYCGPVLTVSRYKIIPWLLWLLLCSSFI